MASGTSSFRRPGLFQHSGSRAKHPCAERALLCREREPERPREPDRRPVSHDRDRERERPREKERDRRERERDPRERERDPRERERDARCVSCCCGCQPPSTGFATEHSRSWHMQAEAVGTWKIFD